MREHIKTSVHEALDNAKQNGYWDGLHDPMFLWTDAQIARDLIECDADLECFAIPDLIDHVRSWRDAQSAPAPSQAGEADHG